MDPLPLVFIGFLVNGVIHEDFFSVAQPACTQMAAAVNRGVKGPRKDRPMITLRDGSVVPVVGAACLAVCPDKPQPLLTLKDAHDA